MRALVVACDPLVMAGLTALLDQAGVQVAGRADRPEDAEKAAARTRVEVVVLSAPATPEALLDHLGIVTELGLPVVVLVGAQDARAAWLSGAAGVLRRDVSPRQLAAALRACAEGLVVHAAADRHLASRASVSVDAIGEPLTTRELEVLRLVADGLPNKVIARRLVISEHTAKYHVNAVLAKLDARNRTEAVTKALRSGLLPL